jgi:hypothetical protein
VRKYSPAYTFFLTPFLLFLYRNTQILIESFIGKPETDYLLCIVALATILLIPSVTYLSFSRLTFLSVIGVTANASICLCLIGISIYVRILGCDNLPLNIDITCEKNWNFSLNLFPRDGFESFSIGIGIYVLSLAVSDTIPYLQLSKF